MDDKAYKKLHKELTEKLENKYIIYLTYVHRSGNLSGEALDKETGKSYPFVYRNRCTINNYECVADILVREIIKKVENNEVL